MTPYQILSIILLISLLINIYQYDIIERNKKSDSRIVILLDELSDVLTGEVIEKEEKDEPIFSDIERFEVEKSYSMSEMTNTMFDDFMNEFFNIEKFEDEKLNKIIYEKIELISIYLFQEEHGRKMLENFYTINTDETPDYYKMKKELANYINKIKGENNGK